VLLDGIDVEAREQCGFIGVSLDLRGIQIELFAPDKTDVLALLHDPIEEAAEDCHAVAVTDFGQAGVVRERLMQIVAEIPAQTEPIGGDTHELAFGAEVLKKPDQLKFEKDDRVNGGSAAKSVAGLHELADKGEVERPFDVAIEMVLRNELLERHMLQRAEAPNFGPHHVGGCSFYSLNALMLQSCRPTFNAAWRASVWLVGRHARMAEADQCARRDPCHVVFHR
jgi:hypothetical protein